jgi:hypothetical protein
MALRPGKIASAITRFFGRPAFRTDSAGRVTEVTIVMILQGLADRAEEGSFHAPAGRSPKTVNTVTIITRYT